MPPTFTLAETDARLQADCPHCGAHGALRGLRVVSGVPPWEREDIWRCPACQQVALRAGLGKRLASSALLLPFAALLLTGLLVGLWGLGAMLADGLFSPGFAGVFLLLIGGAGFGLLKTGRSLARLLGHGLLPIARDADGTYLWQGQL